MRVAGLICSCWGLIACGTQYSDPIREELEPAADPCASWTTESECRADTEHGCSFQPNEVGCRAADPDCAPGICRAGDPFVRRSGQTLWLRGEPYTFVGTVSWGIAWGPECSIGTQDDQTQALQRTFDDLAAMRAQVLKVWAFQSFAGPSGADYASFERIVAAARRAGVRLIFVLENHWTDCTSGGERDDGWYGAGHLEPYGSYTLSFRDYVAGLVDHFRNEPTLLAWELMHEAQGESFEALDAFAAGMTALVRERDANHLIALGLDNGNARGTSRTGAPSNYFRLHSHQAVDLIDAHDFYAPDEALTGSSAELRDIAATLTRPIFAGATAVELAATTEAGFRDRALAVENKLVATRSAGFVGFLIYDYIPEWDQPGWHFDGRPGEPLAGPDGVVARHVKR